MIESGIETMGMKSINIERFTKLIKEQFEDEDYTPMLGLGLSGIGKTESPAGLCKEMGIGCKELRLVTLTETDMLGIPIIVDGRTDYASNNLLPDAERDGERGLLILDEITSASSSIRAAAYQLLDSKRALGNYKLPEKWLVIAVGNGPDDGGVFTGMESAFLNRCRCYRIEPDMAAWKRWAVKNNVNATIMAFVSFEQEFFHKMGEEGMVGVFPSPRSWTSLSKKLNSREEKNGGKPLDREAIEVYASGCVGVEAANRFAAFYEYNKDIINAEDILNGTANADISSLETQVTYIVAGNLARAIQSLLEPENDPFNVNPNVIAKLSNACKWIIAASNYRKDIGIMMVQDLTMTVPKFGMILPSTQMSEACPEFVEFCQQVRPIVARG